MEPRAQETLGVGYGPVLLTRAEVCERLNVSPNTLYRWIDREGFPGPVKIGRMARWSLAAVNAWLAERVGEK
ncbi:MAG: helix-turn-helix domain-containing protein [bacterium]|nr:helix-turn-helix domain-containing protein [bacterium]